MSSISDFVDNRWADAKEELKKLDPGFVRRVEETHRLQNLGLEAIGSGLSTEVSLSEEWHRLLEDCNELVMQETILQTVVDCFIDDSHRGLSPVVVGKRFFYHIHSWFIHANTLVDRSQSVIKKATYLYMSDHKTAYKIAKRHCDAVSNDQFYKKIKKLRNQFGHGTTRSWAQAVTKDNLWEGSVATGMTPQLDFDQCLFPNREGVARFYGTVVSSDTKGMLDHIGEILHELEKDIADHNVEGDKRARL